MRAARFEYGSSGTRRQAPATSGIPPHEYGPGRSVRRDAAASPSTWWASGPTGRAWGNRLVGTGVRFVEHCLESTPEDLAGFARLVDHAGVRPSVERTLPLTEAVEAHRLSESGRVGGVVLAP
ncbi:zinc-binding dehydrogenase [Streptomyces sp. NPDC057939]|uniref:zinc-binding dehydrogenase n=1 Tax=Streptomyces sp. NPDC057939 TaxID=3346284 RepID=UPI0036E61CB9